jgi:hypothetical protein
MTRLRFAAAVAAVVLWLPAGAAATTRTTRHAISRAREVFPLPWCPSIQIYTDVAQPDEVAWVFPDEQPCTVYFDESEFKSIRDNEPSYYCALLAHEFGHLSGLGHSSDPHSIMYDPVGGYVPKPCRDTGGAY